MKAFASAFASPFSRPMAADLGKRLDINFTQSVIPTRALPYATGESYKFTRESTVWCTAYDTTTAALKWVEIPANVPPMPGMRWDSINSLWSPYDENGVLIPSGFRKGYWYLPQATNSIAYSRDFIATGWAIAANTTASKDRASFDGTTNGWTITDNDVSASGRVYYNVTVPNDGNTHIAVIRILKDLAEPGYYQGVQFLLFGGSSVASTLFINNYTGTIGLTSPGIIVEDDGDAWRCILTVTNNSSGNTTLRLSLYPSCSLDGLTFEPTLQGEAGFDQAEIRLNTTFYDGSPIVTNGSALTRLRGDYRVSANNHIDSSGMILCVFESGLNSSQLTIFAYRLVDKNTGSSILYYRSTSIDSSDGATNLSANTSFTTGDVTQAALRWSGSSRALVVDGVETTGAYGGAFTASGADIIIGRDNTAPFYLRSLKYYTADRGTVWIQGQQA